MRFLSFLRKVSPAIAVVLACCGSSSVAEEEISSIKITHVPVPIAAKGKPFPVIAGVESGEAGIKSVTLQVKSDKKIFTAKIKMKQTGEGSFMAMIPAKTTASSGGMLYRIVAADSKGVKAETAWFPLATAGIEDAAGNAGEQASSEPGKAARTASKIKSAIVAHPYIAAGAGIGTVAIAASAGGGGGGGSGDSGGGAFAGTISGSWSGTAYGMSVSGSFSAQIGSDGSVSGSYSGPLHGTLSGSVSADGSFTASGSAGGAVWSGSVTGGPGSLSASGNWTGYDGAGSWHGSGG